MRTFTDPSGNTWRVEPATEDEWCRLEGLPPHHDCYVFTDATGRRKWAEGVRGALHLFSIEELRRMLEVGLPLN